MKTILITLSFIGATLFSIAQTSDRPDLQLQVEKMFTSKFPETVISSYREFNSGVEISCLRNGKKVIVLFDRQGAIISELVEVRKTYLSREVRKRLKATYDDFVIEKVYWDAYRKDFKIELGRSEESIYVFVNEHERSLKIASLN